MNKKILVAFSGGIQSALCAIEAVKLYGSEKVVLLNHDITSKVEHESIKLFKKEISELVGVPITYANMKNFEEMTPLKLSSSFGIISAKPGKALCSYYLKTEPFYRYLKENCSDKENWTILYGFTENEQDRIERRRIFLRSMGYETQFPLAEWKRTIRNTDEIGIKKPTVYKIFQHANCVGCLKANSMSHWYCVYCLRADIFQDALQTEEQVGYSILHNTFLKDLIPKYEKMQKSGICPSDKGNSAAFWAAVNNSLPDQPALLPCDCML